jgi:hypothetical protein
MSTADWVVLAFLLSLAALLGWLEIRYLARRDRNPDEEVKWPEWGTWEPHAAEEAEGSLVRSGGAALVPALVLSQ